MIALIAMAFIRTLGRSLSGALAQGISTLVLKLVTRGRPKASSPTSDQTPDEGVTDESAH